MSKFECSFESHTCMPCRDCQTSECTLSCSMDDLPKPPLTRMDCVGKTCADPACKDSLQCGNHDLSSSWSTEHGADEDPMEAAKKRRQDQEDYENKKATEREAMMEKIAACRKLEDEETCNDDASCSWDSLIDGSGVCRSREEMFVVKEKENNPSESLARVALNSCDSLIPGSAEYIQYGC